MKRNTIISVLTIILTLFCVTCNNSISNAYNAPHHNKIIPNDAFRYNGSYYYVFSKKVNSWEEAERYCESLGGHLAIIDDDYENETVYNYMIRAGYQSAYIGLTDAGHEGQWYWVDGRRVAYTNWSAGEPNNAGGTENYGMYYWKFKYTWNDGDFRGIAYGDDTFICEWDDKELRKPDKKPPHVRRLNHAHHNVARLLDSEEYANSMLENVIATDNSEEIRKAAEEVLTSYPDNEMARIVLLRLNESNRAFVENYIAKYSDDIFGQYVYLHLNDSQKEAYAPLINRVRAMYTEDEFYNMVEPTVILNMIEVHNFYPYSKESYLSELFEMGVGLVVQDGYEVLGRNGEAIYALAQYDTYLNTIERINDYIRRYPPEYFINKRDQ